MSDSVKKYYELMEEGNITGNVKNRQEKTMDLLAMAVKAGKIVEVETRAKEVQKEYKTSSVLLGLQIAVDEILGNDAKA